MTSSDEAVRRYFLDTEFIEDGRTIDLVSIGVVCDDGRAFYAESTEADLSKASPWVQENVLPHLTGVRSARWKIAQDLIAFVMVGGGKPEFWGYYADYDWVAVCQLFGTMMDLPDGWPMFCMDIKQLAVEKGNPKLPEQTGTEHNALADARWNAQAWTSLTEWPARAFDRWREYLGRRVRVILDLSTPVLVEGVLLAFDEGGEARVLDDMGLVHYCWPMLEVEVAAT